MFRDGVAGWPVRSGMLDPAVLAELRAFRTRTYGRSGPRRDALFELLDAAITSGLVPSLVHLSPDGLHRCGWGSLSAALAECEVNVEGLRGWALSSPEPGYHHHPSRHSAGEPIVAGWFYSWLAQVGPRRTRWSAPPDVRRVDPRANAHAVAAERVRAVLRSLPVDGPGPTLVLDAGSDPVRLVTELGRAPAAVVVRLQRDRASTRTRTPCPASRKVGPQAARSQAGLQ
jgi:hypothetical protein